MKVLQIVQKNLALSGLFSNQQQSNARAFNRLYTFTICLALLCTSILVGIQFFHVANSKEEYMYSLFTLATVLFFSLVYGSFIVKRIKIYDTIDLGEKVLNESAFQLLLLDSIWKELIVSFSGSKNSDLKKLYERRVRLVEDLSKFIHYALVYVGLLGCVAPKTISSCFNYYATDSGPDAFELPLDMW